MSTFTIQASDLQIATLIEATEAGERYAASPSEVSSITFSIIDLQTGMAVQGFNGATITPSLVMLSEPLDIGEDPRWQKRTLCNYLHSLSYLAFPNGSRDYRYEATVRLTNGQQLQVVKRLSTLAIYGVAVDPTPDPGGGGEDPDPDPGPDPDPVAAVTLLIVAVSPDPRLTPVSSITIVFSREVTGFTISSLSLTRNDSLDLLTGSQTLSTSDNITFTLSGLASITADAGDYVLSFDGSGITDSDDNEPADATEVWAVQEEVPVPVFGFPTADSTLRTLHGTTKTFSPTFGITPSNWNMAFDYGMFVVWKFGGADVLVRNPQDSDELQSGNSTGAGTYTMRQMWDYAANRFRSFYPDMKIGLYLSGGYVWAKEWLFQAAEYTSVYPQAHVHWDESFGFDGATSGWGITSGSAAISGVAQSGGYLVLSFATPITMPTGSIIKITGNSNSAYNVVCNVTSGTSVDGGGTTSTITTDVAYDGSGTGGSIQGGARKAVPWSNPAWVTLFMDGLKALTDTHRSRHAINNIYIDEQAHEQISPNEVAFSTKANYWEDFTAYCHARDLLTICNMTWQPISKSYVLATANIGGKARFTLRNRITLSVGQQITVSGNGNAAYNTTHTVTGYVGRLVQTSTNWAGTGTGGTLENDGMSSQRADAMRAFDGFTTEGMWPLDQRTQAITPTFLANLRDWWNAGFTLADFAIARNSTYTITSSQNKDGYTEFTTSTGFAGPIGSKIGVYGHSVSGLNTTHYVRDVATSDAYTFTVETAYSSAGTGGGLVYSDLGRLVPVNSISGSRVTCAEAHRIFPMEALSGSLTFYGSLYSGLSGTYTPTQVGAQPSTNPTLLDINTTASISGRGYLIDNNGQRRFWAGVLCIVREPGDRGFETQDPSLGPVGWYTWHVRLGLPTGAAVYTYSGGQDPRCTLVTRTYANGSISLYPQLGYVDTIINGVHE